MQKYSAANVAGNDGAASDTAGFVHVGPVRQWEVLIGEWDRFQRVQTLDHAMGFCNIADSLQGYRRPDVFLRQFISDQRMVE